MKKYLKGIVIISILAIILSGCVDYEVKGKVDAKCISKNYKGSYVYYVPIIIGKITTLQPRIMPEQHIVTIEYNGLTDVINSKELYDVIEVGDVVEVNYYESLDKEHKKIVYGATL